MIAINLLTEKDIGRWIIYKSTGGDKVERGRLKSWNKWFIFAVYNANGNWDADHWKDYTAAATNPEDLSWSKTP